MSLTNEDWNPDDYVFKDFKAHRKLTKNNLALYPKISDDFIDYHANEEVPCLPYQRLTIACINKHGFETSQFHSDKDCMTAKNWLHQCMNNLKVINLRRKYWPEQRLDTDESTPVARIKDIL